jgi:hypothetical protein
MPLNMLQLNQQAQQKALNHLQQIGFKVVTSPMPHSFCIQRSMLNTTLTLYSQPKSTLYNISNTSKDSLPEQYITEITGAIHKVETKTGIMMTIVGTHNSTNIRHLYMSHSIEDDIKKLLEKGVLPSIEDKVPLKRFSPSLQMCYMNYISMLGVNNNVLLSFNDVLFFNYITFCQNWIKAISELII